MGKTRRLKSQIRNLPRTFPPPVFHRFAIFDEDTISGCRTSASNPQVGYDEGSNESIFAVFVVPEEKILVRVCNARNMRHDKSGQPKRVDGWVYFQLLGCSKIN